MFTTEQLVAVLNGEEKFFDAMQLYLDKSVEHLSTEESKSTAKTSFGMKDTISAFRACCSIAETKLVDGVLSKFAQFDGSFGKLDFEHVANDVSELAGEIAKHISFETHFWLKLQEELIRSYMYCFFKSILKKQIKLSDVKDKPAKDKEIYVNRFDQNKSELFDDLRELIDGAFPNIPLICSRIKDSFPEIFVSRNIVALIKLRTDADKKEIEEMVNYCETKFAPLKPKPNTQDSVQPKNTPNLPASEDGEKEFDMESWQRAGGLDAREEDKDAGLKAHISKTVAGNLEFRGSKRYFSVQGGKMFCYKNSKETLADNDTFPTLELKEIKSASLKGNVLVLKFTDTSTPALEFAAGDEDLEKWVDCIQNNLDDFKESSPKRVIAARASVRGKFEVAKLTPAAGTSFCVEAANARTANFEGIDEELRGGVTRQGAKPVVIYREPGLIEKYFFWMPCCVRKEDV